MVLQAIPVSQAKVDPAGETITHVTLNNVKGMDKLTRDQGVLLAHNVEAKTIKIRDTFINSHTLTGGDTVDIKNSRGVIHGQSDLKQVTLDSSAITLETSTIQQLKQTSGSIQSEGNTYQSLTLEGGSIDSRKDKVQGECSLTKLVGVSELRGLEAQSAVTLSGDKNSRLVVVDLKGQTGTISDLGSLELTNAQLQQLDLKTSKNVFVIGSTIQTVNAEDIKLLSLDGTISMATLKNVDFGVTKDIQSLTVTDSTIKDDGSNVLKGDGVVLLGVSSTITEISDSVLIGKDLIITNAESTQIQAFNATITKASDCQLTLKGGTATTSDSQVISHDVSVTADGSLVLANGGSVTNLLGFTLAKDVSAESTGGCAITSDGTDITTYTALGDVNVVIPLGDYNKTLGTAP